MEIKGKVIVVTGAGSGIGRAIAQQLAPECRALALCDKDPVGLAATRRSLVGNADVFNSVLDVGDREAMQDFASAAIQKFGHVDIVINIAGVALGRVGLDKLRYEDFTWVMNTNFWGMVHGTKAFLPYLLDRPQASLVNVSSLFGLIGVAYQIPYCSAKFAIRGFTESLRMEALDLYPGLHVMSVHPGGIKTEIASRARRSRHVSQEVHDNDIEEFEAMLSNTADYAAKKIIKGIRREKGRIVIGKDAHFLSFLQRLLPSSYIGLVGRNLRNRLKKRDAKFAAESGQD